MHYTPTHTYKYTHTHPWLSHTYIYIYTHTHRGPWISGTHIYTHTCIYVNIHIHTGPWLSDTHIHTHIHGPLILRQTHTCSHTYTYPQAPGSRPLNRCVDIILTAAETWSLIVTPLPDHGQYPAAPGGTWLSVDVSQDGCVSKDPGGSSSSNTGLNQDPGNLKSPLIQDPVNSSNTDLNQDHGNRNNTGLNQDRSKRPMWHIYSYEGMFFLLCKVNKRV